MNKGKEDNNEVSSEGKVSGDFSMVSGISDYSESANPFISSGGEDYKENKSVLAKNSNRAGKDLNSVNSSSTSKNKTGFTLQNLSKDRETSFERIGKSDEERRLIRIKDILAQSDSEVDRLILRNTFEDYYKRNHFKNSQEYKQFEEKYNLYDRRVKFGITSGLFFCLYSIFSYADSREKHYHNLNDLIKNKPIAKSFFAPNIYHIIAGSVILATYTGYNLRRCFMLEKEFKEVIYTNYFNNVKIDMLLPKIVEH